MTDDIVTRLRGWVEVQGLAEEPFETKIPILFEAADEIERLRQLVVLCPKCYEAENGVGRWEQEVHGE